MIKLEKITGKNVWDILKLCVWKAEKLCGKQWYYCWLSYEPENEAASQLYHSFGFVETGEMDGEELIAILKL